MDHWQIEMLLSEIFRDSDFAEYPFYPVEDWKYEVVNNDTRLGYRDWLYNRFANQEEE